MKSANLQKKPRKFLLDDNTLRYEDLFEKAVKVLMRVPRLRVIFIEIYKTINSLNQVL